MIWVAVIVRAWVLVWVLHGSIVLGSSDSAGLVAGLGAGGSVDLGSCIIVGLMPVLVMVLVLI